MLYIHLLKEEKVSCVFSSYLAVKRCLATRTAVRAEEERDMEEERKKREEERVRERADAENTRPGSWRSCR